MTIINNARDFRFPGDNTIKYSWCQPFLASSCRTAGLLTMQDILNEAAEKAPLENILQHIVTN